jgi:hypothetical protein
VSQIKHKLALYEIFEAAMVAGKSLEGLCEEVLKTNISKPKGRTKKFITLSDFTYSPVSLGRVKDKFALVTQDIICGSFIKERLEEGEVTAEYESYQLALAVRTILRANQTLVSTTYSNGVAKRSLLMEAPQEFVLYYDTSACIHTLILELRVREDD